MTDLSEGVLLGFSHPLLDIICNVEKDFLNKYGLKPNDSILADERHKELFKDIITNYKVKYIAGGSAQNTLRTIQWMLNKPNCTTFMGTVGDDDFGRIMAENARADGVNAAYIIDRTASTGTCACLINDNNKNRSLVAYWGASKNFHLSHLLDMYEYVEKARVIYVTGYHLIGSPEISMHLAQNVHNSPGKIFTMNLSAPYICQKFSKLLLEVLPYIDILFGNDYEAQALADVMGWQTKELKQIAKLIAITDCKRKEGRTVIITQGRDNILVAYTTIYEVQEFEVRSLDESLIVDTSCAGDSFVGGFFAQYLLNKPLEVCIESGIYAAQEVIQHTGCQFPNKCEFYIR